ncbi:PAS domain S-box protein [Aquincola sp. S2]|uniref:histidine kinase n=1 Tax=Pseudaquabacterium terrae TaxID=2732868 RepID=A0ABX2EFQ7_9BURK|nr:PAS domain S-box protein [Aquabacterium terrae]NRF67426.1 PAS domain S-box protein [Aquabacterium terrae]
MAAPPNSPSAPVPAYRLLFERNPLPMFIVDRRTRCFLAANQAAARAYGYSEDEFRGMTLFDIRPIEDRARLEAYLASVPAAVPSPEPTVWRHRRRNGEVFEVEVVSDAIDFDGQPARLVMVKDLTPLRRAEAELLASERRFRRIVETAREGIWSIDAEARTTFVNPALARMLGYAPAEMLNRPLFHFMDDEGRIDAERNFERRRAGLGEQHDFRFRHKEGHAVWATLSTSPIFNDDGTFGGALAMVTDITERKLAAAQAFARSELMTMVAGGAPLGDVMAALARHVESELAGARVCIMALDHGRLRLLAAPALPDFFREAADGLVVGPQVCTCGVVGYSGRRQITEEIASDPNWTLYRPLAAAADLVSVWSEPILGRAGALLGTFGIYRGRRHAPDTAEFALVAGAAQIAAIVIERKRADEALRESQKMESLGTLAGGIAHDFNNILGAILGNLSLLRQQPGIAPGADERLAQIDRSAQRARNLVQQILAFSRRQPQALRAQPLQPLVEESLALLRASLPASVRLDARLAIRPGEAPLHVRADATQIQQVLMNLCSNAWHALQEAAGRVEVGLEAVTLDAAAVQRLGHRLTPGAHAHLWVRDSGSGMDEATRARIFEPFFTTKPVGVGTGLGLAVVHGIVTEHGGAIAVDSAPECGSTFHLYFPAVDAADAAAEPTLSAPASAAATADRPRHILCIDDDEVMRLTEEGLLTSLGYLVTGCETGREAIEAVRAAPFAFDLVIADYNMPDLSGIDVARALARVRPALPVLISSGYITEEMRAQAAALGVRGLVRKENTVDELGPAVQQVLSVKETDRST